MELIKICKIIRNFTIGLLVILSSGCSKFDPNKYLVTKHNTLLLQGHPTIYADGYVDGCSTGKILAGNKSFEFKRSLDRYKKEILYAKGWLDGKKFCEKQELAIIEANYKRAKASYYNQLRKDLSQ